MKQPVHVYDGAEHRAGFVEDCLMCQVNGLREQVLAAEEEGRAFLAVTLGRLAELECLFGSVTTCGEAERDADRMCRPCWARMVLAQAGNPTP